MERAPFPLATTLASEFEPESNVCGRLSDADGRFLLPHLGHGRTVQLGLPRGTDAGRWAEGLEAGGRVLLLTTDAASARDVAAAGTPSAASAGGPEAAPGHAPPGGAAVEAVLVEDWDRLPIASGSVPVVSVGGGPGAPPPSRFPSLAHELARVAGAAGAVVVDACGWRGGRRARRLERSLARAGFADGETLWLLAVSGSVRMVVQEGDLDAARRILSWLGRGASLRRLGLRVGVRILDGLGLLNPFLSRRRVFLFRRRSGSADPAAAAPAHGNGTAPVHGNGTGPAHGDGAVRAHGNGEAPAHGNGARPAHRNGAVPVHGEAGPAHRNGAVPVHGDEAGPAHGPLWPPPYLRSVLEEAGIDPDGYRCGFHVHGRYDSNKVAFYLFDRTGGGRPRHIVKATRAPRFNVRLENEHRSLSLLEQEGHLPPGVFPERTLLAHRAGLALLGLRFVPGRPMRQATSADPECPLVRGVVRHLEGLAASSARRDPASAASLRLGLDTLHQRFLELYPVEPAEADFLERQLQILHWNAAELPLVFQHGDAGIWNVMVHDGETVLLDWEAGEPAGLPLWDLFYFLRSVGSWSSSLRGERNLLQSYREHFLMPSPLGRFQARVVERYRKRLDISPEVVGPLLYTCWMHRALRNAMQLSPAELTGSIYYRLLLASIRRRDWIPGQVAP